MCRDTLTLISPSDAVDGASDRVLGTLESVNLWGQSHGWH